MSGNRMTTEGEWLVVEPFGADKLWSFTRRLRVPIARIVSVRRAYAAEVSRTGWREPGKRVPQQTIGVEDPSSVVTMIEAARGRR